MKHSRRHFHNLNGGYIGDDQQNFTARSGVWGLGVTNIPMSSVEVIGSDIQIEDFETGALDGDWTTTTGWDIFSTPSLESFSGGFISDSNSIEGVWSPTLISTGNQITEFEIYYHETGSSSGHAMGLRDDTNTTILAIGTNNPQWNIWIGSTAGWETIYTGDGVNRWVRVRLFNFNWTTGDFDFEWEDTNSGTIQTGTRTMESPTNVQNIAFSPTNIDQFGSPFNNASSAANNAWCDNIKVSLA